MGYTVQEIKDKWCELLDYAKQNATGEGFHRGCRWLQDAFNEYMDMSDSIPGYGMGGQSGSNHNREVLAGRILLELGNHIGGQHVINEKQEEQLKETLKYIVDNPTRGRGLGI